MIKLMKKRRTKINTLQLLVETQKEELLSCYRKIDLKDQKIIELLELRNELQRKNKELLKELKELREKKCKKC